MIRVDGMTLQEISEKYDVPIDTVRHRYSRGIRDMLGLTRNDNLKNGKFRIEFAHGNGRRLAEEINKRNISYADVITRSGVSRSTLWEYIYNNRDMSSMRLAKVCGAVGCSMDYVMGLKR